MRPTMPHPTPDRSPATRRPGLARAALALFPAALVLLALLPAGCGEAGPPPGPVRLAVLGDSITAGFGLPPAQAYPALVESALAGRGWDVEVVNAGVSGDTTADGLARVDAVIGRSPDVVLVALGGNDGMRARPLGDVERDLGAIVDRLLGRGIRVGLVGVDHPKLRLRDGNGDFGRLFGRVAETRDVPLLADILDGLLGAPGMMRDPIHPSADGQRRIAERVTTFLLESDLLRE